MGELCNDVVFVVGLVAGVVALAEGDVVRKGVRAVFWGCVVKFAAYMCRGEPNPTLDLRPRVLFPSLSLPRPWPWWLLAVDVFVSLSLARNAKVYTFGLVCNSWVLICSTSILVSRSCAIRSAN